MKAKIQNGFIAVLTLCVGYLFYLQFSQKSEIINVGFVRSQELVYQFDGMQDAMAKFEMERQQWMQNVDTLKADYQMSLDDYNSQFASYSQDERLAQENRLQHQYNNLLKYSEQMEATLNERETVILDGVLNQVNAFSKEFAQAQGLDLIITTASAGNILFGEEDMDYTEELLGFINDKYNGQG